VRPDALGRVAAGRRPSARCGACGARGRAAGASARRIVEVYRREAFGGLPTAPEQERELRRELTKLARHAAWMLLLAALLGGRALAQTGASEVSSDATVRRHEDLRVLQRRLEESRRRLAAAEKARAGLKQEIDTLDLRLEVAARERDVIAARRAELVKTTEALSSEAEQARTARERAARMLRARILLLSRLGRFGYLRLMLSVEDPREVVSAMKTLHAVARADAGTLARFSEAGRRLDAALANEMAARRDAEKLLAEDREQEGSGRPPVHQEVREPDQPLLRDEPQGRPLEGDDLERHGLLVHPQI